MALTKKEVHDKDLKAIMSKDLGDKNPVFGPGHIEEMHKVFSLYADPRLRRTDIRDIMLTACSLGLDSKFDIAFKMLEEVNDANNGNALDFETFVKELTKKIVLLMLRREDLFRKRAGGPLSILSTTREKERLISRI